MMILKPNINLFNMKCNKKDCILKTELYVMYLVMIKNHVENFIFFIFDFHYILIHHL